MQKSILFQYYITCQYITEIGTQKETFLRNLVDPLYSNFEFVEVHIYINMQ